MQSFCRSDQAGCGENARERHHLLVDVLQERPSSVLAAVVLGVLVQRAAMSEVGLGVDVVKARPRHHQLAVHQLDVLQEGQTFLALPPRNLLAVNAPDGHRRPCGRD